MKRTFCISKPLPSIRPSSEKTSFSNLIAWCLHTYTVYCTVQGPFPFSRSAHQRLLPALRRFAQLNQHGEHGERILFLFLPVSFPACVRGGAVPPTPRSILGLAVQFIILHSALGQSK